MFVRFVAAVAAVLTIVVGTAQTVVGPIVVLISFDGWRWDYIDRAEVPHLRALAARGVRADGLIPVFPAKTFPNHYTLVTGLYPERHGIVANVMVDPLFPQRFTMSSKTAKAARWWGGEPLWNTAMRQGRRAASMFWPGSEAAIGGLRPTYWKRYDESMPNAARVAQVLEWLALPTHRQPTFITLYFNDVDSAGHAHGPDSPEVKRAANRLDRMLGELVTGAARLNLMDRLHIVVVSDHGMAQVSDQRVIYLEDYQDLSTVIVTEWSPMLGVTPRSGTVDAAYHALKGKHPSLAIYRREETPAHFRYRNNPRIPPIVGVAEEGWTITTRGRAFAARIAGRLNGGAHGYDPALTSMHGVFVVAGPRVREGVRVPAFESVHVYNLLCALLELKPAPNDGDPRVTRRVLRE